MRCHDRELRSIVHVFAFWVLAVHALAVPSMRLFFTTAGPLHELRRTTVDGRMVEQVLLPNLAAPDSPNSVRWLSHDGGIVYWTDNYTFPSLQMFHPSAALPGQRMTTLLIDKTGAYVHAVMMLCLT